MVTRNPEAGVCAGLDGASDLCSAVVWASTVRVVVVSGATAPTAAIARRATPHGPGREVEGATRDETRVLDMGVLLGVNNAYLE